MLEKLNPRERLFVVSGVGALLSLVLIFVGVKIYDQRQFIRESVLKERENVQIITRMRDDIRAMPSSGPLPDENEFLSKTQALLDRLKFTPQNIRPHKENVSANEEQLVVELTFSGVALKDALEFLHAVEYSREIPARVASLEFRKPLPQREIYDMRISLVITRPRTQR